MTFLPNPTLAELGSRERSALDAQLAAHGGSFTPIDAALLANLPSFEAYRQWHVLREEIALWIGDRATLLFAYAISEANGCPASAQGLREILIASGDDPDAPQVTEAEQLLIDWGRLMVTGPHTIPDDFVARLEATFGPARRVGILSFAGLTVATNLVATVGRIPVSSDSPSDSASGAPKDSQA